MYGEITRSAVVLPHHITHSLQLHLLTCPRKTSQPLLAVLSTDHAVCANSKNARGACSGELTWPEAKQFCEEQGARLCSQEELFNDDTHGYGTLCPLFCGCVFAAVVTLTLAASSVSLADPVCTRWFAPRDRSGCNYDYRLIWSSTSCNACGDATGDDSSYQVDWGYSRYRNATAQDVSRTGQECRAGTDTAYTRCCTLWLGLDFVRFPSAVHGMRRKMRPVVCQRVGTRFGIMPNRLIYPILAVVVVTFRLQVPTLATQPRPSHAMPTPHGRRPPRTPGTASR